MHLSVVAALSIVATLTLSFVAAGSAPASDATPAGTPAPTPTINPTVLPRPPLKCLQKGMTSYCIPNTSKYQVCSPTTKVVECPIDSFCKETTDAKGNTTAYCKFIG